MTDPYSELFNPMKTINSEIQNQPGQNAVPGRIRKTARGQALLIVALVMTVLILFVGLAVDTGNLMAKKAKLQSAVDTSALSAAGVLQTSGVITQTAVNTAYQVLETNGVTSNTLATRSVTFPGYHQVQVAATQNVNTFFMRLVPAFAVMQVSAQATADLSSYAEIYTKPYGLPGVVNELNLMVWGPNSWRKGGDAFSPLYGVGSPPTSSNPEYVSQPYGYLYRVDVPPEYVYDHILVELFDPDSYNKSGTPPAWPTPYCSPSPCTPTPTPSPSPDQYASCGNPRSGTCTSGGTRDDTAMKLNAFPSGRPAFWRVDEFRRPYTDCDIDPNTACGGNPAPGYQDSYATTTRYTLWHFDTHISSAFADPNTLSDLPTNTGPYAGGCGKCIARYSVGNSNTTDLSWYTPGGFNIQLTGCGGSGGDCYERESNGSFYFYIYVQSTGTGSSENNFDMRVGPPDLNPTNLCTTASNCYVNQQYATGAADWQDGGASLYAKQSLPLNLDTGSSFPLVFTRVNKNAAGQVLSVRHFDQDCGSNGTSCGSTTMTYEMLMCNADSSLDSSWETVGTGYLGPNDDWYCSGCANPETVQIPLEGTSQYSDLFGASGECESSLLRIHSNPSYSQDSTVWQMPYLRPRLIK